MKKFIVIFAALVLASCSSSEKKNDMISDLDSDSGSVVEEEVAAPTPPAAAKVEEPAPEEVKPQAKVNSDYSALQQAIKSGSDEKIFSAATELLTKKSDDVVALNALAMYHFKKGRLDLSKYLVNKAIGINPKMSALYSNLGVIQLAMNEHREAIQSFKKSLQLNSGEVTAAANLGAIYVREKDFRKAAVALEMAYKKGLKDAKFLNNYGIVQTAQGNFPEAKKAYDQSLKLSPDNKDAMLNLSILLIDHMKKYEEGLQVLGGLKFIGGPDDSRNVINALENRALTGLNQQ